MSQVRRPGRPKKAPVAPPAASRFTDAALHRLPATGGRYTVRDALTPGLECRVGASGRRTFSLLYRRDGERTKRRVILGTFPAISVAEARRRADDIRERRNLIDPGVTVGDLAARYLARGATAWAETTRALYADLIRRDFETDGFAARRVVHVTPADVSALLARFAEKPARGNQVRRLVSALFGFAAREGLRAKGDNPTADVKPYKERPRERYLQTDEVARLLAALDTAERTGLPPAPSRARRRVTGATAKHRPPSADVPVPADPVAAAIIRFAMLTGFRRAEVLTLKWAEVDAEAGVVRQRAKGLDVVRPVSGDALAVLAGVPRLVGSPYVFPALTDPLKPRKDVTRLWYAVRHAAGLDGARFHDLRHTAASRMLQAGAHLDEVGRVLGHRSARTSERYAAITDEGARRAVEKLAATMPEPVAPAVVTPIRARVGR
ncbi:MAG: tyrosine-type recombinase/integrase [Gemmatimonadota bacterium]